MVQNLNADLLRAFVTVAEANSFTKAGELLFRTQAAVSMQIKRLEDLIGKAIFNRGRKDGLSLTSDGELLMVYARRILHLNDEVFANMSLPQLDGIVRIGAPDDYATILLPDVLLVFRNAFPEIQVEVCCDNSVELIREVNAGRLDLALVTRHADQEGGELVRGEQLFWITSELNSPHQSDPLPLALFPNGCVCREIALRSLRESNRNWKIIYASTTIAAIMAMVTAGVAISVVEESIIPPGTRRLGVKEGFPALRSVDVVLYRAPGKLRPSAVALAEHIHLWLSKSARPSAGKRVIPPASPIPYRKKGVTAHAKAN